MFIPQIYHAFLLLDCLHAISSSFSMNSSSLVGPNVINKLVLQTVFKYRSATLFSEHLAYSDTVKISALQ